MHECITAVTLLSVFLIYNSPVPAARLHCDLRQAQPGDRPPAWNKTAREKVLHAGNLTVQS
jgi:hypothetical protein